MIRRRTLALAASLGLVVSAGAVYATADAPANVCDDVSTSAIDTTAELKRYVDCRDDRIEQQLTRIEAGLAKPSPPPSPSPTSTPSPTPSPTITAPAPSETALVGFPNASTTGVPAGWTPTSTRSTDLRVTTAGAVVEDVRLVNASLIIDAPNVTVRRVEIQGGKVENYPGTTCRNGLVLEQVSLVRAPGQVTNSQGQGAISTGGYTARKVKIDGLPEGFRVGGKPECGPVSISDSFARVRYPENCNDWHGDGIQGYGGPALTVRNLTVDFIEGSGCGGTAPFFVPSGQGNTTVDVDRLLVKGGGFAFRNGVPGKVTNLKIVNGSYGYGPIDVKCSVLTSWSADVVTIDANYQPTTVRSQPCNTETGN